MGRAPSPHRTWTCSDCPLAGDDSMRMSHLKVGSAADIPINISETDLSLLTATVVPPSGREEPCLLKRLRNGHVGKRWRGRASWEGGGREGWARLPLADGPALRPGISFVPKETGEHLVHVKKNGQHVASSPIPVVISQSEIGDASRVRVSGQGLHEGHTFEPAEFIIDTRDAGRWWPPTSWGGDPRARPPGSGPSLSRLRRT